MNKIGLVLVIVILTLASNASYGGACLTSQCISIETEAPWLAFIDKERQSNSQLVTQVLNLHTLREKRDLPNSMVRISPNDDIKSKVKGAISDLRNSNRCAMHKILSCMVLQNYDESLSRTAIEASLRLSDKVIQRWINALSEQRGERKRNLVEEIRENIRANP